MSRKVLPADVISLELTKNLRSHKYRPGAHTCSIVTAYLPTYPPLQRAHAIANLTRQNKDEKLFI